MCEQALELDTNRSPVAQYLDIQAFVNFCIRNKLEAAHPGYGSLAENENFAKALEANGIAFFVEPTVEKLNTFGDKTAARHIAISNNVPAVPSSHDAHCLVEKYQYMEQPRHEVQCRRDDADKVINLWDLWFY